MKRIPEETKVLIRKMRDEGMSYSAIAEATGHSRSRIVSGLKTDFASTCRYMCSNCGGPTNSERKLCNKPDCRKIYLRERMRDLRIWYTYSLTADDLFAMLEEQDGMCAIPGCDVVLDETNMHIDHDHRTGKPRRPICRRHNNGLGFFNDDPSMLRAAADYLEGTVNGYNFSRLSESE